MSSCTVANETVNHLFILDEERWRLYLSNQTGFLGTLLPARLMSHPQSQHNLPGSPRASFPKALARLLLRIIITVIVAISFFKRVYTLPREALKKVICRDALLGDK